MAKDFGHWDLGVLCQVMQDCDLVFNFLMARKDSSNGGKPNNYTIAVLKGDSIANIASPIGE
ncbi:hypothetical protein MY4824_001877 [Beauveria thailandica]